MVMIDIIAKIGFFFIIACIYSFFSHIFLKITRLSFSSEKKFNPIQQLPVFTGIILPITSTVLLGVPIGFLRNTSKAFLDEIEESPVKIASLGFTLSLNFFLLLLIKLNYPALIFWSENFILYFWVINTFFILFNTLPLYPSIMSYFFLLQIKNRFLKKFPYMKQFKWLLIYRDLSAITMIFIFLPFFIVFNKKIDFYLFQVVNQYPLYFLGIDFSSTAFMLLISLLLFLLLILSSILYKVHAKKYEAFLKKTLKRIREERSHHD
ncbi:MAG TPA: hypothetical protein DHW82_02680 [Spirochaetia bacterium]|nr:MAG: hypothetical protein A2Y41_10550 [Spirochaetes bacterium GWB1_36_13]HCL55897.1 hypothetical protein [Spirochaetia bacterium]